MEFKYIIKCNGQIAFPVHSDMIWNEFVEYIRLRCKPLHKNSFDVILKIGFKEYINPKVMSPMDFANEGPLLMGIK